jgi:hypothetical protein
LIFHHDEKSTSGKWIRLARRHLKGHDPGALIGSGTNAYFAELNRERPPVAELDLVSYSLNPQVHAFDNASLVEALETQAVTVASARQFTGTIPLAISPITLKPRFNPNAIGAVVVPSPVELPSQVDVRQMSLFGACWTIGSLSYVAASGVYSVTYYETTGWRGVMEIEVGSPLQDAFRSLPGSVFPLYHVLADVGEFSGGQFVPTRSSDPLQVNGLALAKDEKRCILLANMSGEAKQVTVSGLAGQVRVHHLDETNALEAIQEPERFRCKLGGGLQADGGVLGLELLPYSMVRIDYGRAASNDPLP